MQYRVLPSYTMTENTSSEPCTQIEAQLGVGTQLTVAGVKASLLANFGKDSVCTEERVRNVTYVGKQKRCMLIKTSIIDKSFIGRLSKFKEAGPLQHSKPGH